MARNMLAHIGMTLPECEYCNGAAELSLGELRLCQLHGSELQCHAGGLALLLEMSPEGRRALADSYLSRVIREDVLEPSAALQD
jgi:hypothetical protein